MVKIDNKEINRLENNDPRKFENVNIYAGDSFNYPANARLKNLQYNNIEDTPITIGNRQIDRHVTEKSFQKCLLTLFLNICYCL